MSLWINHIKPRIYWVPCAQAAVIIILSLIGWLLGEKDRVLSFFVGGCVSFVPMFYFASRAFPKHGALDPGSVLWRFFRAEVIKLFLVALLFIAVIRFERVLPIPLIFGFITAQLSLLLMPILFWLDSIRHQRKHI